MSTEEALFNLLRDHPRGITLNAIIKDVMVKPTKFDLPDKQDADYYSKAISAQLGKLFFKQDISVLLIAGQGVKFFVAGSIPNKEKLPAGSVLLKPVFKPNSQEIDDHQTILDLITQTKERGITGFELWDLLGIFYTDRLISDPRLFNGIMRSMAHRGIVVVVKESKKGAKAATRYFIKSFAPKTGTQPSPKLGKPKNQARKNIQSDRTVVVSPLEMETKAVPFVYDQQVFAGVTLLEVPEWGIKREYDPPVSIKLCFGCLSVNHGLLISGDTQIILTVRKTRLVSIHEHDQVTLEIQL